MIGGPDYTLYNSVVAIDMDDNLAVAGQYSTDGVTRSTYFYRVLNDECFVPTLVDLPQLSGSIDAISFSYYGSQTDEEFNNAQVAILGTDLSGTQILVVVELTYDDPLIYTYEYTNKKSTPIAGSLVSSGYDSYYWITSDTLFSFSTIYSLGPVQDGTKYELTFSGYELLAACTGISKVYALARTSAN